MDRAAIDWARTTVLAGDPAEFTPDAVAFLLRDFVISGDAAVGRAVEEGLTRGLAAIDAESDCCRRVEWLRVLADGSAVSEDERLQTDVGRVLPDAIDALERLIRRSYEPGDGLAGASCADELTCASALLAGFALSGRLPYAMLAEELVQHARRRSWTDAVPAFEADWPANCVGLRLLCQLAALHADPSYRASAVLAPGSGYALDARRMVAPLTRDAAGHPQGAGAFARALHEWFALESNLQ